MKYQRERTEAVKIAARRLHGLLLRGKLQRSFLGIENVLPVLTREAFRELRIKQGVSPNLAPFQWYEK